MVKDQQKCMVNNNVIVIGALGQDGSFMCDILVEKGFNVIGVIKEKTNFKNFNKSVTYVKTDISNVDSINKLLRDYNPIQIYNFMGISDVFDPWTNVSEVFKLNFNTPINIIDCIKNYNKNIKYLNASSSLVFGNCSESPQSENSIRNPIYPYGYSKNFIDDMINLYRSKFSMSLYSVILYSHESERRGENFFTKKVIRDAILIKNGEKEFIELGDVESMRDVGYAKDYMYACFKVINSLADNYIIGNGSSIKNIDFVKRVFSKLEIPFSCIKINNDLKRNIDLSHLVADISKIRKLDWSPTTSIDEIIDIMIEHELKK